MWGPASSGMGGRHRQAHLARSSGRGGGVGSKAGGDGAQRAAAWEPAQCAACLLPLRRQLWMPDPDRGAVEKMARRRRCDRWPQRDSGGTRAGALCVLAQVLRPELLRRGPQRVWEKGVEATDDVGIMEEIGEPVLITPGSYTNIKARAHGIGCSIGGGPACCSTSGACPTGQGPVRLMAAAAGARACRSPRPTTSPWRSGSWRSSSR